MSNNPHHNTRLTLAALIVPTLIVAIAPRIATIPGPSAALATPTTETEPTPPTITQPTLTPAQRAALEHRRALAGARPTNPFHYPIPQDAAPDPYANTPPTPAPSAANAPPTMLITSIAAAQGRGIAIINGTLRNQGDTIAEGWSITNINPTTRTVTIQHTDGTTHTESQTR